MKAIREQIAAREESLKPVYLQAATEFADLHDKTGRMKAKGVIKDAVPWEQSREYFYWRATRRMVEDDIVHQICSADESLTKDSAIAMIQSMYSGDFDDNKAVTTFLGEKKGEIALKIHSIKAARVQAKIDALTAELAAMK